MSTLDYEYQKEEYLSYLEQHLSGVQQSFDWMKEHSDLFSDIFDSNDFADAAKLIEKHDESKLREEEFSSYAKYFYGTKTEAVKTDFDFAWLHHIHSNPHHWQYWVLINDTDGTKALDMPKKYIIEMICDHWAFSWRAKNLTEILSWYNKNKSHIIFSDRTKEIYEKSLKIIKENL